MLVRLIEVVRGIRGGTASLSEIYINSAHIVSVAEDIIANESLINEVKSLGLIEGIRFSKLIISEGNQPRTITVVGGPTEVYSKIKKKQVLRG